MKKKLLSIFSLLLIILVNAQTPTFQWAKNIGGTNHTHGNSIFIDLVGNVYTTGYFNGVDDFDPGVGIFNLTSAGFSDIYVSKLDPLGNFLWAIRIGGTSSASGSAIENDGSGNIFVFGSFSGTVDFDPGAGIFNLTSAGSSDIYVLKLDPLGNFLWALQTGGSLESSTLDATDNIYITGSFIGVDDFDPGAGIFNLTSGAGGDAFILKLNALGNFVWVKQISGSVMPVTARGMSISIDSMNNVYSTGYFCGNVDFDPGIGIFNLVSPTFSFDIYVSKLDSLGNFVWAKQISGIGEEEGISIKVDRSSNVYTTGYFGNTLDFDPNAGVYNLTSAGSADIFILKLNSLGDFQWAKSMGGTSSDAPYYIALDDFNNVYTTGRFTVTADFNPGIGVFNLTSLSQNDIFISKLDSSGVFKWAAGILGGTFDSWGKAVEIDQVGNVYTVGTFDGVTDFDPSIGIFNLTAGPQDMFVHKMSQTPTGIEENSNINSISIFPNPANDQLTIETTMPATVSIVNLLGQELMNIKVQNSEVINISKLSSGVYYIIDCTNHVNKKVIKQ